MAESLPQSVQPFLTWLTAKPRSGEAIVERSPLFFVAVALSQSIAGVALSAMSLHLAPFPAVCVLGIGLLLASAGLGLFQVVVFHHCSHGTVFKSRQANVVVGRTISAILLFKHFDVYKAEHMLHHNHKKLLTEEDEFADFVFGICGLQAGLSKRALWRRVLVNIASPGFHGRFLMRRVQAAWGSHDRLHNALGIGVWAAAAAAAALSGHGLAFLVAWVLPVSVLLQVATVFRILCEHRFPEPEMILARGRDFAAHATAGVFPGSAPPDIAWRSAAGLARWALWWANMLTVQVFVRLFVLVGDAPCHDFHHRRPASRKWTSYIQARQLDVDAGAPGFRSFYQESWGLFRAIDENLASLSRTPSGVVG
jgi:fatty acid desaturase